MVFHINFSELQSLRYITGQTAIPFHLFFKGGSFMKCKNCGAETYGANFCPLCGHPLEEPAHSQPGASPLSDNTDLPFGGNPVYNTPGFSATPQPQPNPPADSKHSILGIIALILGCTLLLSPFGLVLSIIDIVTKDGKKKTFSYIAAGISGVLTFFLLLLILSGSGDSEDTDSSNPDSTEVTSEAASKKNKSASTGKAKKKNSDPEYEITDSGLEYHRNSIGDVEYYGFVEITNTGKGNIYLSDCTFDLEDDDGHLLQSDDFISKCPYIIRPGEKGYFFNNIGSALLDDGVSTSNGIHLVPQISLKSTEAEPVEYDVSDTDIRKDNYGGIKITGRVTNNTEDDDSFVSVRIIFYDNSGKVIGITSTTIDDLDAGSTVSFDTSTMFDTMDISIESVADYKVVAQAEYYQW